MAAALHHELVELFCLPALLIRLVEASKQAWWRKHGGASIDLPDDCKTRAQLVAEHQFRHAPSALFTCSSHTRAPFFVCHMHHSMLLRSPTKAVLYVNDGSSPCDESSWHQLPSPAQGPGAAHTFESTPAFVYAHTFEGSDQVMMGHVVR
jgi:hypothetical protein